MAVLVGATKGLGEQHDDVGQDAGTVGQAKAGTVALDAGGRSGELRLEKAMGRDDDHATNTTAGLPLVRDEPGLGTEPVVATPEPAPPVLEGAEAVICGVFGGYCLDALAVARCESGPDYYEPPAVYHTGTFQLAFRYHTDKFANRGWDMYASGDDIYQNSAIAFEIFAGRGFSWLGTSGWPVCGWEAGY